MKQLLKLTKITLVCLFIVFITTLSGCKEENIKLDNYSIVEKDALDYYGRIITVKDFPNDKILTQEYIDKINISIKLGDIGFSQEDAIVPLIFDKNDILYTAKRFNGELLNNNNIGDKTLYTDLKTFQKITKLPQATSEYVNVLPNINGEAIRSFDPYVKFFEKLDEISQDSKYRMDNTLVSSWNVVGNIIIARWDGGGISDAFGHTGGISWTSVSSTDRATLMKNTKIVEASNRGNSLAGVTIGTQNGVFERYMTDSKGTSSWNSSLVYWRTAVWYPSMTSIQRTQIATYMKNQLGEPYNLNSTKTDESQWYCSKVQWMAYKKVLNVDIDRNGGATVYPSDIQYSPLLVGVSF